MGNKEYTQEQEIIKNTVNEMLETYGVKEFPTPIDELIEFSKLSCSKYNPNEKGLWTKFNEKAKSVFHKIKAILCLSNNQILIAEDIHPAKESFAKGHELGHFIIPWHREILYACSEYDLDHRTREIMEREANFSAAETLFQGDRFIGIAKQFPLHMNTILKMKELCITTSYVATARRYVETNQHSCVLLVLEPVQTIVESDLVYKNPVDNSEKPVHKFGGTELKLSYVVYSESFLKQFGRLNFCKNFSSKHPISKIVNEGSSEDVMESEVKFKDKTLKIQTFYNSYCVMALLIG